MSIDAIAVQRDLNHTSYQTQPIQNEFWRSRAIQNGYFGRTSEMNRLVFRMIGIGALSAGTACIAFEVTWLLSVPCLLAALGAICYSRTFGEDSEVLERFRHAARRMSLDQIVHAYGWTSLLQWGILTPDQFTQKYRQHLQSKDLKAIIHYYERVSALISQTPNPRFVYHIPTPHEWRGKWREETQNLTFEQIFRDYPLEKLEFYNLLEINELNHVKILKRDYDRVKSHCEEQLASIEEEFQNNTRAFRQAYTASVTQAHQQYNDHLAVRGLQSLDLDYSRERQTTQNQLAIQKNQARTRFIQAIATFMDPRTSYERLQPFQKQLYDHHKNVLRQTEIQIENEGRAQIAAIDAWSINSRIQFNSHQAQARVERDQLLAEAQVQYEAQIAHHQAHRSLQSQPIRDAFHSSVNDLNERYRCYLRIF